MNQGEAIVSSSTLLGGAHIHHVVTIIAFGIALLLALLKHKKTKQLKEDDANGDKNREKLEKETQGKNTIHEKIISESSPTVSHVLIRVTDIKKSKKFYTDLGFVYEEEGASSSSSSSTSPSKCIILKSPSPNSQPYLVLQEKQQRGNSTNSSRHCADVGYARVCFLVSNVSKEIERMTKLGYDVLTDPVTDRPGSVDEQTGKNDNPPVTIVSYCDPDHNVVELVSLDDVKIKIFLKVLQLLKFVKFPTWVHVNINATSYDNSWNAYQKLGFMMGTEYGKVVNTLYKALDIPSPGIAKYVALINLPNDVNRFNIDLIEWEDPKTISAKKDKEPSICVAIAVKDVSLVVDTITKSANSQWKLTSIPQCVNLPSPLGSVIQVKVEDPDGTEIILMSKSKDLLDKPKKSSHALTIPSMKKSILVTGCDSGFGRSLSTHLCGIGFHVISVCYTPEGAAYLSEIADTIVADLTTDVGLEKTVEFTKEVVSSKKNQLWGIVNNAGMACPGHLEWTDPSHYKKVMNLNFHAPIHLIHNLLPLLKDQCRGRKHMMENKGTKRVMNVTSVCGFTSAPSNSVYSSSKWAMEALSDALRLELFSYGIDVTVIEPTTMRTPLGTGWATQWKENYDSADELRKSNHALDSATSFANTMHETLEKNAEDMMITVKHMMNALVVPNPPSRILCGEGAKAFKFISWLPDKWKDSIYKATMVPTSGLEDE